MSVENATTYSMPELPSRTALVENEKSAAPVVRRATDMVITDDKSFKAAGQFLQGCKAMKKRAEETFGTPVAEVKTLKSMIEKHRKTLANILAKALAPWEEADAIVRQKMLKFSQEQERKRQEEERIAAEKAREELRLAEEAAKKKRDEEIAKAAAAGRTDVARTLAAAPLQVQVVSTVAPMKITKAPVAQGFIERKTWEFRILDPEQIPRKYMTINQAALNAEARHQKAQTNIPGGIAVEVVTSAVR